VTPTSVVIDASATIAWAFNERDRQAQLDGLLVGRVLTAPAIWRLEVVNIALVKERRRTITPVESERVLELVEGLGIEVVEDAAEVSLRELAAAARPLQLSAYDSAYLQLAVARQMPLLTMDHNLQNAARRLGVGLVLDRHRAS